MDVQSSPVLSFPGESSSSSPKDNSPFVGGGTDNNRSRRGSIVHPTLIAPKPIRPNPGIQHAPMTYRFNSTFSTSSSSSGGGGGETLAYWRGKEIMSLSPENFKPLGKSVSHMRSESPLSKKYKTESADDSSGAQSPDYLVKPAATMRNVTLSIPPELTKTASTSPMSISDPFDGSKLNPTTTLRGGGIYSEDPSTSSVSTAASTLSPLAGDRVGPLLAPGVNSHRRRSTISLYGSSAREALDELFRILQCRTTPGEDGCRQSSSTTTAASSSYTANLNKDEQSPDTPPHHPGLSSTPTWVRDFAGYDQSPVMRATNRNPIVFDSVFYQDSV